MMTTKQLWNSTDAAAWAAEFMREHGSSTFSGGTITEDVMRAWFTNAIAAGRTEDSARREEAAYIEGRRASQANFCHMRDIPLTPPEKDPAGT